MIVAELKVQLSLGWMYENFLASPTKLMRKTRSYAFEKIFFVKKKRV
jgi:hypothetical protein